MGMHDGRCNENYSNYSFSNFRFIIGPIFYFLSPEWSILLGGLIGGTIAYFIGELNVN